MEFTVAMSTEMASGLGGEATFDLAADLGFTAVELTPVLWDAHFEPSSPSPAQALQLKQSLARRGLAAPAASMWYLPPSGTWAEERRFFPEGYRMPSSDPATYSRCLAGMAEAAPTLGVETLNVFIFPFMGGSDGETLDNFVRGVRPALEIARGNGLTICMEQDVFCPLLRAYDGIEAVFTAVDHPNFGLTFDPANFYLCGLEAFPDAYRRLAPLIRHVHVRNCRVFRPGDPEDERFFPFTGERIRTGDHCSFVGLEAGALNIGGLLRQLAVDGYRGVATLQALNRDSNKLPALMRRDKSYVDSLV